MPTRRKPTLENTIETALAPSHFVGYRDIDDFIAHLEIVRAQLVSMLKNDPARAAELLETFIAGCYEKSEEIDDSGGSFGQLVKDLFCDWIRARRAAKAAPAETATMLLSWMETDQYGYTYDLAPAAAKAFDKAGLAAFEQAVRAQGGSAAKGSPGHRQFIRTLRAIFEARRDAIAYAALCEEEQDLAPADCEVLARMCLARRRPADALGWVERGLALEKGGGSRHRPAWDLARLHREILTKLGRSGEALDSAWESYREMPCVPAYEELMRLVPAAEREAWHAKALQVLDGVDLRSRIDLLLATKERELLAAAIDQADRAELVGISHYVSEPIAKLLARQRPLLAAKLQAAMALRILEAKKSKYYDAALANLENARKLMLAAGRVAEWQALAREIGEQHRRKTGFIAGFNRLCEGRRAQEPSFLERARKRWDAATGEARGAP